MISTGEYFWSNTLSTASRKNRSPLKTGITTLTKGPTSSLPGINVRQQSFDHRWNGGKICARFKTETREMARERGQKLERFIPRAGKLKYRTGSQRRQSHSYGNP